MLIYLRQKILLKNKKDSKIKIDMVMCWHISYGGQEKNLADINFMVLSVY